jgi:hypothetical protein
MTHATQELPSDEGHRAMSELTTDLDAVDVASMAHLDLPEGSPAVDSDTTITAAAEEDAGFGELVQETVGKVAMGARSQEDVAAKQPVTIEIPKQVDKLAAIDRTETDDHSASDDSDREITDDFRYQYGHKAVAISERLTRAVIEEDEMGERWERVQLADELTSLREDFARWEAGLKEPESDAYFEATGIIANFNTLDRPNMPATLVHVPVDGGDPQALAVRGRLKVETADQSDSEENQRLFTWLQDLSDDRLVNYFQWSEARTDTVSDALVAHRGDIEQKVRGTFEHLITDGLAPESAREALERGFEYTTIFGALSSFESGFYQAAGVFDSEARRLGVNREYNANEVEKYTRNNQWVFFHEALHEYDAANDTGLTYLTSEDEEPLTWVDEAVKQHLTEAGTNGQPNILNPTDRYTEGVYKDIRELLHLVLTGGELKIGLHDVMAANFECHNAEGPSQRREELAAQLRSSYQDMFPGLPPGETILHVIAKEIEAASKPLQAQVVQGWIEKMSEWRDENLDTDWALAN